MMTAHQRAKAQAILLADAANPAIERSDIARRLTDIGRELYGAERLNLERLVVRLLDRRAAPTASPA